MRDDLQIRDSKLAQLESFALFAGCSSRELIILGKLCDVVEMVPGSALQIEGSTCRTWWVLGQGSAAVNQAGHVIGLVGPGDFIGEASVLSKEPAPVTVVTLTHVSAFAFDRRSLLSALHESPAFSIALLRGVISRHRMYCHGAGCTNGARHASAIADSIVRSDRYGTTKPVA
jgi:CRP-like cAMP-binding protein